MTPLSRADGSLVLMAVTLLAVIGSSIAADRDPRIEHVVVVMMENRPFDHLFGWARDLLGVDGLTGNEFNLVDPNDPSSERIYVNDKAPFMNDCDPAHTTPATTKKLFSTDEAKLSGIPDMGGFVAYQNSSSAKNYCNVMQSFPPSKVPILTALASEYAIMDRFFASHPGPTWPNRMFALTGTSAGSTETSVWYKDLPGKLYPQKTIYDQVEESGLTWRNYFNDTPWELILEKVAHSPHNLHPLDQFYKDAKQGQLPSFAWINPRSGMNTTTGVGSNDQHPDHDISAGEQYYKDIYEALRASPKWEQTLFVITYDEHGGFFDHVVPPTKDIPPPGDGENAYPDFGFQFDRLGIRVPTLLISPWIKKGTVLTNPPDEAKPAKNSEYELTSIISSARKLLGMDNVGSLTDRDAWSATFDHALYELDEPRTNCPMHLPEALAPELPSKPLVAEQDLPLSDLQSDVATVLHHLGVGGDDGESKGRLPEVQGHLSEWLQQKYETHKTKTVQWLASKGEREGNAGDVTHPVVVCKVKKMFVQKSQDKAWYLNGLPFGDMSGQYANSKAPYITLSAQTLRSSDGAHPLCLDGGDGKAGSRLGASPCYPSRNPDTNRDPMQHFLLHNDGTLRLYNETGGDDDALCVTNHVFASFNEQHDKSKRNLRYTEEQKRVTLEKCDNNTVAQTFAYHGKAPGDAGGGYLEFGDIEFFLGVEMQ